MIISETELAPFVSGPSPADRAHALLLQQKGVWDLLRTGYETLQTVRSKAFDFDGFHIKVQFNPGRLTSTAAKVDPRSIQERKCFLCTENLPPAQRGIACDGEFVVLCNPFPIFPEHFTITFRRHLPQRILTAFDTFLSVTRELGTRYTVLYNGPQCGASAPDHLHFQAGNRAFLPIDAEYEAAKTAPAVQLHATPALRAYGSEKCLRRFISFESSEPAPLRRAFETLHRILQEEASSGDEPMMNILGFYASGQWRIILFPRVKHRPAFYFHEGDAKLLISPAAVEMGGICVTPRAQDFERVTRDDILQMFDEVCAPAERFAGIKARLAEELARAT